MTSDRRGAGALPLAFALGSALIGPRPARADELARARLEVVRDAGSAGCAGQADLEQAVAERLGRNPFDEHAQPVVRVTIATRGKDRVAQVRRLDAKGDEVGARAIASTGLDCAELSSALALALAIAMDPERATTGPPKVAPPVEPRPAVTPVVAPVAARAPPMVAPPPRPPADVVHAQIGADVHAGLGSAPATAVGFGGHVELRLRRFELDVEGRGDLPASRALVPSGRVASSLLLGRLAPCVHVALAYGCALGSVGALTGTTNDVPGGRDRTTAFGGLGGRIGVELPIFWRLSLRPHAEIEATLVKTTLSFDGQPAWVTPGAYGALALEVAVQAR